MTMNMRFFIIAAAATLLAACTQENEVQNKWKHESRQA